MPLPARDSLRPALVLIAAVLAAKLIYIFALCPYDLVEDEAHYWLWSRHIDWSYYSKGPGIAWVIGLSTRIFGHAEWAVRLPTVLAQTVGALACAGLIRDIARRAFVEGGRVAFPSRAALLAAAAYFLAPAFQLTGILVTIDGCYLACWSLACWAAWRALCEGSRFAWLGLGLAIGLGFLFKYTILLLPPGFLAFVLLQARRPAMEVPPGARAELRTADAPAVDLTNFIEAPPLRLARAWRAWAAAALAIFLLALVPVLIWNARQGWPTIAHLLGHLGVAGGDMPPPATPVADSGRSLLTRFGAVLGYLFAPIGMVGPLLILALIASARVLGKSRFASGDHPARRLGAHFLLCAFAPIWLFYLVVSFIAEPEQNWAIAGFVPLVALAGWYAADELARRSTAAPTPELALPLQASTRPARVLWRLGLFYGLGAAVVLHRGDLPRDTINACLRVPAISRAIASITGREPRPIVTGRLIGSEQMAGHAARLLDRIESQTHRPPMLMCEHYGRASQMAYYLFRAGRAEVPVLSTQSVMGGRRSQFDFWPETDVRRADLIGRPALLMSNDKPRTLEYWQAMFESIAPLDTPDHKLEGEHKRDRIAYIAQGYKGVP